MVQLKYDYLLPIGSVVKVKGVERKLMIYGILQRSPEAPDKIFDYVGAPLSGRVPGCPSEHCV